MTVLVVFDLEGVLLRVDYGQDPSRIGRCPYLPEWRNDHSLTAVTTILQGDNSFGSAAEPPAIEFKNTIITA